MVTDQVEVDTTLFVLLLIDFKYNCNDKKWNEIFFIKLFLGL
jgi:hypothetical protein